MSTTIDQKVVEMKFDNGNFEKNVSTTMGTLQKLKQALHLDGASKGLDEVNNAAANNKMGVLGSAAEAAGQKFNALQTIATGALFKIGAQALTTGQNLIKSLAFDQIQAGFSKYEEKTQAIQTIMAGTGKSAAEVNEELQKLIWFADETSYSFTDMTSNIAKFTAQGVDLKTAETAMQGISTWAAISGKNSQAAEHAMYNLSQALGAGAVKLQDWKSITNVNMDTVEFKKTVLESAAAMGELNKEVDSEGIEHYFLSVGAKAKKTEVSIADFTSTMKEGWFTSEVLLDVLGKYGEYSDGLYEVYNTLADLGPEYSKTTSEIIKDMEALHGADDETILNAGYTEDLIPLVRALSDEYDGLGARSFKAAQEAITFAQAIDATKDAVSSQWMQTFEYIFGDISKARVMWTDLANDLWDIFAAGGENRNIFLNALNKKGALSDFRDSVIRIFQNVLKTITLVKDAFANIFPGPTVDRVVEMARNFDRFTRSIQITDNVVEALDGNYAHLSYNETKVYNALVKLRSAFEGFFSVCKLGNTVIYSIVKVLMTIASEIFPSLSGGALTAAGDLGEFLKNFNEGIISKIEEFTDSICDFIKSIKDMPLVQEASEFIRNFVQGFRDAVDEFSKINIDFKTEAEKIGIILKQFFNPSLMNTHQLQFNGLNTLQEYLKEFTGNDDVVKVANHIQNAFVNLFNTIKGFKMPDIKNNLFNWLKEFSLGLSAEGLYGGLKKSLTFIRNLFQVKIVNFARSFLVQLYELGNKFGPYIEAGFKKLKDAFLALKQFIFGSKDITVENIADIGKKILQIVLLIKAINVFDGVGDILENIGDAIGDIGKSMKLDAIASVIKSVALMLVAIAAALAIVGNIPEDEVWRGVGVISVMAIVVSILVVALTKLTSSLSGTITGGIKDVAQLVGLALVIAAFAGAIFALTKAVKDFGDMKPRQLQRGITAMILMIGSLAIATGIVAATCRGSSALSTGLILAFVLGLQKILGVIVEYNDFDWEGNEKGLKAVIKMMLVLSTCMKIMTTRIGKDEKASSSTIALIAFVLGLRLLLKGVEQLGSMPVDQMRQGLIGITALIALLTGAIVSINLSSKGGVLKKGERSINQYKGLATALLGLCIAIVILGNIPRENLIQGGVAVGILLGVLAIFVRLSAVGDQLKVPKLFGLFVGIGLLIGEIAYIVWKLTPLGGNEVLKVCEGFAATLGALTILMGALAVIGKIKMNGNSYKNIVAVAVISAVIAYALMPGIIILVSKLEGVNVEGSGKKILALAGMMMVITAFAAACMGLSKIPFDIRQAGLVAGVMVGIGLITAGAIFLLHLLEGVNAEGSAKKIAALAGMMSVITIFALACIGISKINFNIGHVALVELTLAGMTIVLGLLAGVFKKMNEVDGANAIEQAKAMSLALLAITGIIAIFTKAQLGLESIKYAAIAAAALGVFLDIMIANLALIGALAGEAKAIRMGAEVMGILGEAIGKFIGGIAAGAINKITETLPALGVRLGMFYTSAKPFFNGMSELGKSAVSGVKNLAEAIIALTVAELLNGVANFVSKKDAFLSLGKDLSSFWIAAQPFFSGVNQISNSSVSSAQQVADLIKTLTAAELINGINNFFSLFTGRSSFADFGYQLADFGSAMQMFSNSVRNVDALKIGSVVPIVKTLVEISKTIENNGGMLGGIVGNNTWSDLGQGLSELGDAIADFGAVCRIITAQRYDVSIGRVLPIVETLIQIASTIQNDGGLLGDVIGNNNWGNLATGLVEFGDALQKFGAKCVFIVPFKSDIEQTIPVIDSLIKISDSINNSGGAIANIVGDNNWSDLATGLEDFGEALKGFGESVVGLQVQSIQDSIPAIEALAEVGDLLPNFGGKIAEVFGDGNWVTFGTGLAELGKAMANFSIAVGVEGLVENVKNGVLAITELSKIGTLTFDTATLTQVGMSLNTFSADFAEVMRNLLGGGFDYTQLPTISTSIKDMVNSLSDLGGIDANGMNLLVQSIADLGTSAMTELANGITTNSALVIESLNTLYTQMITSGTEMSAEFQKMGSEFNNQVLTGIRFNQDAIRMTFINGISAAVTAAKNKYSDFYSAGQYLVSGFINGIESKIGDAASKAAKMAKEAYDAACNELGIHSPSRLMMTVGAFFAQGFSRGIEKDSGSSEGAAMSMAGRAADAVTRVVSSLSGVITSRAAEFQQLGTMMMEHLSIGLQNSMPLLTESFVTMFNGLFQGMLDSGIQGVSFVADINNSMISEFANYYVLYFSEGMMLMSRLIDGMRSKSYYMVVSMRYMLEECIRTINGYRHNFYSAGQYMVDGFVSGMDSKIGSAARKAAEMAKAAYDAACSALGIHSPSREFYKIGAFVGEGFVNGVDSYAKAAGASGASLASKAMKMATEILDSGMDLDPVITPVLDLTNVEAGAKELSSILSKNQALTINASFGQNGASAMNVQQMNSQQPQNITFTQNNYSPKALSRVEIYRQTNNQISKMKESFA